MSGLYVGRASLVRSALLHRQGNRVNDERMRENPHEKLIGDQDTQGVIARSEATKQSRANTS